MSRIDVRTVPDVAEAARAAVVEAFQDAVAARDGVLLCLPGGRTPLPAYRALASRADLDWRRATCVIGDERWVPPDHPERNEGALRRALLDHVPIDEERVLAWPWGEALTPEEAAERYAERVRAEVERAGGFDLTLLGLGADGHAAGLFPGTGAAGASGWAIASRPASQPTPRLSLTAHALSRSRRVIFLVSGEEKRDALRALSEDVDADAEEAARERTPARAIGAMERLEVLTDLAT